MAVLKSYRLSWRKLCIKLHFHEMLLKKATTDQYIKLFRTKGESGLYRHFVGNGIIRAATIPNPDIELLDLADEFFALSRRRGADKEAYFLIGKALRRAAHTLYRQFLRIKEDKVLNPRFLNTVS